jgi:hypothetical protein
VLERMSLDNASLRPSNTSLRSAGSRAKAGRDESQHHGETTREEPTVLSSANKPISMHEHGSSCVLLTSATAAFGEIHVSNDRELLHGDFRAGMVRPEELRELQELIILRAELDSQIWNSRKQQNRDAVESKMQLADEILARIRSIVASIDDAMSLERGIETEHKLLKDIRERVDSSGLRIWQEQPPWDSDSE